MPLKGYYTTAEAAAVLGLAHATVRHAVYRGVLKVERLARHNLIPVEEVERYRKEVQGTHGWGKRREPGYTPNEKQRTYQQRYYQRRKVARKQQPAEPAQGDPGPSI